MRHYDIEMLRHAVPITDVMAELGLDHSLKRNVICPGRDHQDKRPSAKIYEQSNICFCFACNKRMNPIDIISETLGMNFRDACDWMIDRFPEYCKGAYEDHSENSNTEKYPLTGDDLKLLKLKSSGEGISLYELWKEDRESFNYIVSGKVESAKERLTAIIEKSSEMVEYFVSQRDKYLEKCGLTMADLPKLKQEYPTRCFTPDSNEYKLLYYSSSADFEIKELNEYKNRYERILELGKLFPYEQERDKEEEIER